MTSHTPGPWFLPSEGHGSKGTQVWARGGDVRVANCDSASTSLEGRRADARLIAAAPDLLEALKLYQSAGFGQSTDHHAQGLAYDAAVEAIAKATGSAT